jgi:hypothetical protein
MDFLVTIGAKGDQVFGLVVSELAARTDMMHIKIFPTSALLAPPTVSSKDLATELLVSGWRQSQTRRFGPEPTHADFCRREEKDC